MKFIDQRIITTNSLINVYRIFKELWHNQPNSVVGIALAIFVVLGIYIKLLDMYK